MKLVHVRFARISAYINALASSLPIPRQRLREREREREREMGEEKKEEEEAGEIVLKVDMHCEACARKVARSLKGFQGVEEVRADSKAGKVVVKGKSADPRKVSERLRKKSRRKVELLSPLPKLPPPDDSKAHEKPLPPPDSSNKDEPAPVVTAVLNVRMHCEACAQVLQKRIRKIKGVESVETNLANDQVIVKGVVEPAQLVNAVYKKTRKQVAIVKEEEKKEEEKKDEKKADKEEEKKEAGGGAAAEANENSSQEEDEKKGNDTIRRIEYWPSQYYTDYAYAPQMFSDENPNACSLM